jgi:hypothetical protein
MRKVEKCETLDFHLMEKIGCLISYFYECQISYGKTLSTCYKHFIFPVRRLAIGQLDVKEHGQMLRPVGHVRKVPGATSPFPLPYFTKNKRRKV